MEIPFVLRMAIQERGDKGKQTDFHWRILFKHFFHTKTGQKWYKKEVIRKIDKDYIKQMLNETK